MASLQDLLEAYRNYRGVNDWRLGRQEDEMLGHSEQARGLWALLQGVGVGDVGGGGGLAGIFAGRNAKTADIAKLARAESMLSSGADRRAIWDETGWFQGKDGQWRFEIPDNESAFNLKGFSKLPSGTLSSKGNRLDKVIFHDALYDSYNTAKTIDPAVMIGGDPSLSSTGSYNKLQNLLEARGATAERTMSTLLHELQHAIQEHEGFARGGNPDMFPVIHNAEGLKESNRLLGLLSGDFANKLEAAHNAKDFKTLLELRKSNTDEYNAISDALHKLGTTNFNDARDKAIQLGKVLTPMEQYRRLAGEAEARLVQARANMTPEQLRARPPWEMYDIPEEQQIVRYGEGSALSAPHDPTAIRSRFAAFDPARAHESDLLASRVLPWATGGLMGYSFLNSDDSMASEGGSRRGLMGLFR